MCFEFQPTTINKVVYGVIGTVAVSALVLLIVYYNDIWPPVKQFEEYS